MTLSIINPFSQDNTNNLDPRLHDDWFIQRNRSTESKTASISQSSQRSTGILKKFILSPSEKKYEFHIKPKYRANVFSSIHYNNGPIDSTIPQVELVHELNSVWPFDQRSFDQTSSDNHSNIIQHQISFSSTHSSSTKQIKRKQIKESDYPIEMEKNETFSILPNKSVEELQFFDARSFIHGIKAPSQTSLHSISPSVSSICDLETSDDVIILTESINDKEDVKSNELPQRSISSFTKVRPATWIVSVPPPTFSPKVLPRKTSLIHDSISYA